jgi:hypothetical protein
MKVSLNKQPPSVDTLARKLGFWSRLAQSYRAVYPAAGTLGLLGTLLCLFLMLSNYIPKESLNDKTLLGILEIFAMGWIPLIAVAILRHACQLKIWGYTPSEAAKVINIRNILDPKHGGYSEVNVYLTTIEKQNRLLTNAEVRSIITRLDLSPVSRLRT